MPTDNPRLMITISEELYRQIQDYQHERRLTSMSKAILDLMGKGIDLLKNEAEETRQVEIAALAKSELAHDEAELVAAYRKLNSDGQHMALGMVESLTLNPAYTQDTSNAAG